MIDSKKYLNRLKEYLQSKGIKIQVHGNIRCFSGTHQDLNPSMQLHDDGFKCHSCGFTGNIYDAIKHFENLPEFTDQLKYAADLFGDSIPAYIPKEKFKIDKDAENQVTQYIISLISDNKKYLNYFAKKRGYGENFTNYLGYWPGYNQALNELDQEILTKSGIPEPKPSKKYPDKKYSSWNPKGVVFKYESGYKLAYINKNKEDVEKTWKIGSHGSHAFPYPNLPDGDKIILCEAEISAIAARINDIPEMTATGGTNGLNQNDLKRLLKYNEIIFCFDGDDPGRKAVLKYIEKLFNLNFNGVIKTCELPENNDPDDLIKNSKVEELKKIIKEAKEYEGYNISKKNNKDENVLSNNNINPTADNCIPPTQDNQVEIEDSFFVKNAFEADKIRGDDIETVKEFITYRPELAFQESARLYFLEKYESGIKLQSNDLSQIVWLYDIEKKYWVMQIEKASHEPMELFIKKYKATWTIEGTKKSFHFKKNITTRNEINNHFNDYVRNHIQAENEPFANAYVKKIISCKNCVLEWNYDTLKFDQKPHDKDHHLTVSPFPFNKLDLKKLDAKQEKRRENLILYFSRLVEWNQDESKDIIKFLIAYIGYTLSPWREKCFHIWIGTKDSGKSTLKEIIKLLHGNKYGEADFSRWAKKPSPHDSEVLPGKLLIADDDFEVGARLPERELKTLSQNNSIPINPKHTAQFMLTNTATPLILTNGMPRAEDITLENRLYAIPFQANFDRVLRTAETEKFINSIKEHETLEILFNVAIDIAEKTIFRNGSFDQIAPLCVKETSSQIIQSASSVLLWIDELKSQGKLIMSPTEKVKRSDLYELYQTTYNGMKKGKHGFYEYVKQRYKDKKSNGIDYFHGLGIPNNSTYENYIEPKDNFKFEE